MASHLEEAYTRPYWYVKEDRFERPPPALSKRSSKKGFDSEKRWYPAPLDKNKLRSTMRPVNYF